MLQNYEKEIKALEENENIKDKLMIISLYNEIFNYLIVEISSFYHDRFEKVMRETFLSIASSNVANNASDFIKMFLLVLSKNDLSKIGNIRNLINEYDTMLSDYIEGMDYVETIDCFKNIPFADKVQLLLILRDYINKLVGTLERTFGKDSMPMRELANDLIDYLMEDTEEYLHLCDAYDFTIQDSVGAYEAALKAGMKNVLVKKYLNGEFSFDLLDNEENKNYFKSFKPLEQGVLLLGMAYGISGYDAISEPNERVEEICKVLNISKTHYNWIITVMTFRKASLIKSEEKEKRKRKTKED